MVSHGKLIFLLVLLFNCPRGVDCAVERTHVGAPVSDQTGQGRRVSHPDLGVSSSGNFREIGNIPVGYNQYRPYGTSSTRDIFLNSHFNYLLDSARDTSVPRTVPSITSGTAPPPYRTRSSYAGAANSASATASQPNAGAFVPRQEQLTRPGTIPRTIRITHQHVTSIRGLGTTESLTGHSPSNPPEYARAGFNLSELAQPAAPADSNFLPSAPDPSELAPAPLMQEVPAVIAPPVAVSIPPLVVVEPPAPQNTQTEAIQNDSNLLESPGSSEASSSEFPSDLRLKTGPNEDVNDSSKYTSNKWVRNDKNLYKIMFNDDANCTEIRISYTLIWKRKEDEQYPKYILYDPSSSIIIRFPTTYIRFDKAGENEGWVEECDIKLYSPDANDYTRSKKLESSRYSVTRSEEQVLFEIHSGALCSEVRFLEKRVDSSRADGLRLVYHTIWKVWSDFEGDTAITNNEFPYAVKYKNHGRVVLYFSRGRLIRERDSQNAWHFVDRELKVYGQDPQVNTKIEELDHAQYQTKRIDAAGFEYEFNADVRCVKVMVDDKGVWDYDLSKDDKFPRSVRYDRSLERIHLQFERELKTFLRSTGDTWSLYNTPTRRGSLAPPASTSTASSRASTRSALISRLRSRSVVSLDGSLPSETAPRTYRRDSNASLSPDDPDAVFRLSLLGLDASDLPLRADPDSASETSSVISRFSSQSGLFGTPLSFYDRITGSQPPYSTPSIPSSVSIDIPDSPTDSIAQPFDSAPAAPSGSLPRPARSLARSTSSAAVSAPPGQPAQSESASSAGAESSSSAPRVTPVVIKDAFPKRADSGKITGPEKRSLAEILAARCKPKESADQSPSTNETAATSQPSIETPSTQSPAVSQPADQSLPVDQSAAGPKPSLESRLAKLSAPRSQAVKSPLTNQSAPQSQPTQESTAITQPAANPPSSAAAIQNPVEASPAVAKEEDDDDDDDDDSDEQEDKKPKEQPKAPVSTPIVSVPPPQPEAPVASVADTSTSAAPAFLLGTRSGMSTASVPVRSRLSSQGASPRAQLPQTSVDGSNQPTQPTSQQTQSTSGSQSSSSPPRSISLDIDSKSDTVDIKYSDYSSFCTYSTVGYTAFNELKKGNSIIWNTSDPSKLLTRVVVNPPKVIIYHLDATTGELDLDAMNLSQSNSSQGASVSTGPIQSGSVPTNSGSAATVDSGASSPNQPSSSNEARATASPIKVTEITARSETKTDVQVTTPATTASVPAIPSAQAEPQVEAEPEPQPQAAPVSSEQTTFKVVVVADAGNQDNVNDTTAGPSAPNAGEVASGTVQAPQQNAPQIPVSPTQRVRTETKVTTPQSSNYKHSTVKRDISFKPSGSPANTQQPSATQPNSLIQKLQYQYDPVSPQDRTQSQTSDRPQVSSQQSQQAQPQASHPAQARSQLTQPPKALSQVTEQPKVQSQLSQPASVSSQVTEQPKVQSQLSQQPKVESQLSQQPKVQSQLSQQPKVESQLSQQPKVQSQLSQQPKVESQLSQPASVSSQVTEQPKVESQVTQRSSVLSQPSQSVRQPVSTSQQQAKSNTPELIIIHVQLKGDNPHVTFEENKRKGRMKFTADAGYLIQRVKRNGKKVWVCPDERYADRIIIKPGTDRKRVAQILFPGDADVSVDDGPDVSDSEGEISPNDQSCGESQGVKSSSASKPRSTARSPPSTSTPQKQEQQPVVATQTQTLPQPVSVQQQPTPQTPSQPLSVQQPIPQPISQDQQQVQPQTPVASSGTSNYGTKYGKSPAIPSSTPVVPVYSVTTLSTNPTPVSTGSSTGVVGLGSSSPSSRLPGSANASGTTGLGSDRSVGSTSHKYVGSPTSEPPVTTVEVIRPGSSRNLANSSASQTSSAQAVGLQGRNVSVTERFGSRNASATSQSRLGGSSSLPSASQQLGNSSTQPDQVSRPVLHTPGGSALGPLRSPSSGSIFNRNQSTASQPQPSPGQTVSSSGSSASSRIGTGSLYQPRTSVGRTQGPTSASGQLSGSGQQPSHGSAPLNATPGQRTGSSASASHSPSSQQTGTQHYTRITVDFNKKLSTTEYQYKFDSNSGTHQFIPREYCLIEKVVNGNDTIWTASDYYPIQIDIAQDENNQFNVVAHNWNYGSSFRQSSQARRDHRISTIV